VGVGERVTLWDGEILEELEGPRGGRAWLSRAGVNLADLTKTL
jgi:hypothetical protein